MHSSAMDRGIRACSTGRWIVTAAALVAAAACGDKTFNTVSAIPTTITVAAASEGQTGVVGTALAQPITVQVTDVAGNPVPGVVVTWTVLAGGGSVSAANSTTDAAGNASVTWTVGSTAGTNTLEASIATGATADITATAVAAVGTTMSISSGNPQAIAIGATSAPMVVHIADQFGNPVAGASVAWTTTGGVLSAASNTTDASGNAQVTLDTAGILVGSTFTVTATSGALTPAVFTITTS
jgi:Big-like domain-containing protein